MVLRATLRLVLWVGMRLRLAAGGPYLLVFLSDELFLLALRRSGAGGDGEVCAALPGQLTAERVCWLLFATPCSVVADSAQ